MIAVALAVLAAIAIALALIAYGAAAEAVRHTDAVWSELRQLRARLRRWEDGQRSGDVEP